MRVRDVAFGRIALAYVSSTVLSEKLALLWRASENNNFWQAFVALVLAMELSKKLLQGSFLVTLFSKKLLRHAFRQCCSQKNILARMSVVLLAE